MPLEASKDLAKHLLRAAAKQEIHKVAGSVEGLIETLPLLAKSTHSNFSTKIWTELTRLQRFRGLQQLGPEEVKSLVDIATNLHEVLDSLMVVPAPGGSGSEQSHDRSKTMDIFISHSSNDKDLARALINLLLLALRLDPTTIRCTSVDGFRLAPGANTATQLRQEVNTSKVFLGLLTNYSLSSSFVLFELGARWGADKDIFPILARGATHSSIGGSPLANLNVLVSEKDQVILLLESIATTLGIAPSSSTIYNSALDAYLSAAK